MSKKKPLTTELQAECRAANALFLAKKNELKLSQKKIADAVGISPAGVAQYLNGTNPLNAKFAAAFSRLIKEPVEKFSPRLAAEIARIAQAAPGAAQEPASPEQADKAPAGRAIVGRTLFEKITPRSRALVDRILEMEAHGALTDEDLKVLTEIVERFGSPK